MAIQIIDNFELGAAKPIDSRFVVGPGEFYTNKNDITYKYTGLRVWDMTGGSPGIGYVWDGTAWQTEASGSITGSGTVNQLPKFFTASNVVADSIVTDNGARIGISWTTLGTSPYNSHKLVVNGSIMSITGGFYGSGANITTINASNITTGSLSLSRLTNGASTGRILISGGSQPEWTNRVQINTAPSTSSVSSEENSIYFRNFSTTRIYSYHNPSDSSELFIDVGGSIMKVTSTYFEFNKQVRLPDGTSAAPALTFTTDASQNTGIYKSAENTLNISANGTSILQVSTTGVYVSTSGSVGTPSLTIGGASTGLYRYTFFAPPTVEESLKFAVNGSELLSLNRVGTISLPSYYISSLVAYRNSDGSEAAPSYSFNTDSNTGIYRYGSDSMGFTVGGKLRWRMRLGGATDFEFWNHNGSGGLNGALVNWGTYLEVDGFTTGLSSPNGIKYQSTIAFSVSANTGVTYNHNLGYIPIAVIVGNDGNVNPRITLLSTTQIRIYNYNTGSNTASGTIYLW